MITGDGGGALGICGRIVDELACRSSRRSLVALSISRGHQAGRSRMKAAFGLQFFPLTSAAAPPGFCYLLLASRLLHYCWVKR